MALRAEMGKPTGRLRRKNHFRPGPSGSTPAGPYPSAAAAGRLPARATLRSPRYRSICIVMRIWELCQSVSNSAIRRSADSLLPSARWV